MQSFIHCLPDTNDLVKSLKDQCIEMRGKKKKKKPTCAVDKL